MTLISSSVLNPISSFLNLLGKRERVRDLCEIREQPVWLSPPTQSRAYVDSADREWCEKARNVLGNSLLQKSSKTTRKFFGGKVKWEVFGNSSSVSPK